MSAGEQGKALMARWFRSVHQIADGDYACTLFEVRATHQGEFLGVPARGNPVCLAVLSLARIGDGRFVEEWELFEGEGLRRQMRAPVRG